MNANSHGSGRLDRAVSADRFGLLDIQHDLPAARVVVRAGLGQREPPRGAVEQRELQVGFEGGNRLAQDRLRNVQRMGGGGERLLLDRAAEKLDGTQLVHCRKRTQSLPLRDLSQFSIR